MFLMLARIVSAAKWICVWLHVGICITGMLIDNSSQYWPKAFDTDKNSALARTLIRFV